MRIARRWLVFAPAVTLVIVTTSALAVAQPRAVQPGDPIRVSDVPGTPKSAPAPLTLNGRPLLVRGAVTPTPVAPASPMQRQAPRRRNHVAFWGGVAMAGVGAYVAAWGLSPYAEAHCTHSQHGPLMVTVGGNTRVAQPGDCTPTTHVSGLFWTGVGLATLGSTLAFLGAKAHVQPGAVRVSRTVRF